MKAIATQKFIRMSPRKLRLVADMARELTPSNAVEILPFAGKRAALPLTKVIKTAIANARVKGMNEQTLIFSEIQVGQGPRYKRWRAGSRGRAKPFTRDTSHIRVVVEDKEVQKVEKKPVLKTDGKEKVSKAKAEKK